MRRFWRDFRSAGLFFGPGVSLLVGFGIMPICLAVYMSAYKWKPVQGRFLGVGHYEKALGDLTSALLVLAAFAVMIAGVWLFTRDWRDPFRGRGLVLVLGVITILALFAGIRSWQLNSFIDSYETGEAWALEIASRMFFDRRGDPAEQIALIAESARAFYGAAGLLITALTLLLVAILFKLHQRLAGSLVGVLSIYAAGQVVSVGWSKMMGSGDTDFLESLIHTVFYCIGTITIQVSLGLIIAFLLHSGG